jgi:hypothetical protein
MVAMGPVNRLVAGISREEEDAGILMSKEGA